MKSPYITLSSLAFATAMLAGSPAFAQTTGTAKAATATSAKTVALTSVKKAPEAFMDLSDVIGLASPTAAALGVKAGDIVEVKAGSKSIGMEVVIEGDDPQAVLMKKTGRDLLGINEGAAQISVSTIVWPTGDPKPAPVTFKEITKPTKPFVKLGKAAGVSLARMRAMGAAPGQRGILSGPNGKRDIVAIYVLDRGDDIIALGAKVRKTLGVEPGPAELSLEPKPGKVVPAETGTSETTE